MNQFEQATRQFEKNYGKPRPSFEHTIKTYQGNNQKTDWFLVGATIFLIGFGLVVLIAVYGN